MYFSGNCLKQSLTKAGDNMKKIKLFLAAIEEGLQKDRIG